MEDSFRFGLRDYRCFSSEQPDWVEIRKGDVIALLGPNNAGKSTLLRAICELQKHYGFNFNGGALAQHGLFEWQSQLRVPTLWVRDPSEILPEVMGQVKPTVSFAVETKDWRVEWNLHSNKPENSVCRIRLLQWPSVRPRSDGEISRIQTDIGEKLNLLANAKYFSASRTLATFNTTISGNQYGVYLGSSLISSWDELKRGRQRAESRSASLVETKLASLLGYKSLSIDARADNQSVMLRIDNSQARELHEVGSGVSQLIYMGMALAGQSPSIVLIDEPETHLHPGMQAKMIELVQSFSSYATIFSTHSIGLARQSADDIYLVSQDPATRTSKLSKFDDPQNAGETLGELSYSQFSALGGKILLLVEGPTELRVFRVWLRKLRIDHLVMIVPLGGGNLIMTNRAEHLREFTRFGATVFAVFDSERESEGGVIPEKRQKFLDDCNLVFGAEHVLCTTRRCTENYFTASAIQKAMRSEKYKALEPYQLIADVSLGWSKHENWKIAEHMEWSDLQGTDMGSFLQKIHKSLA